MNILPAVVYVSLKEALGVITSIVAVILHDVGLKTGQKL